MLSVQKIVVVEVTALVTQASLAAHQPDSEKVYIYFYRHDRESSNNIDILG